MRRILITCDCCKRDIGFDLGDGKTLWGKMKYSYGAERDLCQKCFEKINRRYEELKNEYNEPEDHTS